MLNNIVGCWAYIQGTYPCILSLPHISRPAPMYKLTHQKSLTKEYKPRAYSQSFTVLNYISHILTIL